MMNISVEHASVTDVTADAVVVNLFEQVNEPSGAAGAVDEALDGLLTELIEAGELQGKLGKAHTVHTMGKLESPRLIVTGLGKREDFNAETARRAAACAVHEAAERGCCSLASVLHGAGVGGLETAEAARATTEGLLLAAYRFAGFKQEEGEDSQAPQDFKLVEHDEQKLNDSSRGAELGAVLARATNAARDLGNLPANHLTPSAFADRARELASETSLQCRVLDTDDMEAEGMGILLGVAKGSKEPPRLIVLEHKPEQTAAPTLALVGKALTFDSGGLSLKSSKGMNEMKFDMCGGAAVFGAMQAVAELQPDRHVLGLICATENMPGGGAQRPGDVATGLTGQSVEILNTDAEGRLVLSDGVAYAEKLGAEAIVDIATLTGAASVALGDQAAAVISTDDEWAQELAAAGEAASERLWQLPAWPEYRDQFKSDIADLKNVGGRKAGCIVGGLIIGEFVDSARWAHLDIAGVAWADEQKYYRPKGATGFGVRTLVQLALGR